MTKKTVIELNELELKEVITRYFKLDYSSVSIDIVQDRGTQKEPEPFKLIYTANHKTGLIEEPVFNRGVKE